VVSLGTRSALNADRGCRVPDPQWDSPQIGHLPQLLQRSSLGSALRILATLTVRACIG
jgi:hypothetical protein